MNLSALLPKHNERALLVGMTESGKSTLAEALLTQGRYPYIVIIDPKGTFKYPGAVATCPEDLGRLQRERIIIYRPGYQYLTMGEYDRVLEWVYRRGNTFLYIDEVFGLSDNGYTYPYALKAIYTRGRELNIGVLAATQRPSGIPTYTRTESNILIAFELQEETDRKRMSATMGKEVYINPPKSHTFWYYHNKAGGKAKMYVLDLNKGGST